MATGVQVWSQTAGSNATADSNVNWAEGMAPSAVNDSARAEMSSVAKWRDDNNGTLLTAGTTTAFTLTTNQVEGALTTGYTVHIQFHATADTSATLAVDGLAAKPIQLYPGNNLTGGEWQANSRVALVYSSTGTGQWIAKSPPAFTQLTKSTTADITVANGSYTDGPSVSQGSSGVWLATGTVTVTAGANRNLFAKLWDGTTVIASANNSMAGVPCATSLSGIITNPAGNIKISCQCDGANVTLKANLTGAGKDSTLTVIRIG